MSDFNTSSFKSITGDTSNQRRRTSLDCRLAESDLLLRLLDNLKNADTVPQLFSVTVYIPGTGAGEGFAPAKGDTKVEPGEEATASVAILSQAFPTQGYSITVRAVEDR